MPVSVREIIRRGVGFSCCLMAESRQQVLGNVSVLVLNSCKAGDTLSSRHVSLKPGTNYSRVT